MNSETTSHANLPRHNGIFGFSWGKFFLCWLIGGIFVVAVMALITGLLPGEKYGWLNYLKLTKRGHVADGFVYETIPEVHSTVKYLYAVGDKTYYAETTGGSLSERSVKVTYLPENPNISCIGDAQSEFENEIVTIALGGLVFPPFIMFSYWRKYSKAIWPGSSGCP